MHDWQCHPIWETHPDGRLDNLDNLDPGALPIPESLAESIRRWSARYEATFDSDHPPDSGFAFPHEERQRDQQGLELWRALQDALDGQARVRYVSHVSGHHDDRMGRGHITDQSADARGGIEGRAFDAQSSRCAPRVVDSSSIKASSSSDT